MTQVKTYHLELQQSQEVRARFGQGGGSVADELGRQLMLGEIGGS